MLLLLLRWKWLIHFPSLMQSCSCMFYYTLNAVKSHIRPCRALCNVCVYVCFSANRIQGLRRPSCLTLSVRFTSPPTVHRWTCSPMSFAATWSMWSSTSPVFTGEPCILFLLAYWSTCTIHTNTIYLYPSIQWLQFHSHLLHESALKLYIPQILLTCKTY